MSRNPLLLSLLLGMPATALSVAKLCDLDASLAGREPNDSSDTPVESDAEDESITFTHAFFGPASGPDHELRAVAA